MRTDILSFVLASENRKEIVKALFEYPKRQWSCSALEELTKMPHATVYRTLSGLKDFGILKSAKINKKDIIYELVSSPLAKELERAVNIGKITSKKIAQNFANRIKSKSIHSVILYGSAAKGTSKLESDIDILVILGKKNKNLEGKILNIAAQMSSKANKTISAVVMNINQMRKEKGTSFIKSVMEDMEILYGKEPFWASQIMAGRRKICR